jgi:hypothetical protein
MHHKHAFDLLLKEAWNPEQAAMGNSTLPTVCDKFNIMAAIHNRKLIATFACVCVVANLFDHGHGMKRLLCVYPESTYYDKKLLKRLAKDLRVAQLFNTDLPHVQNYLFTQLKVESTCKVQVQYDSADSRLISLTKMDEFDLQPPPF